MKILVSGATGFVGRPLCLKLLTLGHDLAILTQSKNRIDERFPYPAEVFAWDSSSQNFPEEALQGVDAVIHLAGEPIVGRRWDAEKKQKIYSSRVERSRQIATAVRKSPQIKTFLSASAIGYYGDRGHEELDENTSMGHGFLAEVCKDWEQAVLSELSNSSVRTAIFRIGLVLERQAKIIQQVLTPARLGVLGPIGKGHQWMSWIHREDLINLIVFALENTQVEGILNATAPEPVTNREWTKTISRKFVPWMAPPIPSFALKLALGDMAQLALSSQKVLPMRAQVLGFTFKYPELNSAVEEILQFPDNELLIAEQWVPQTLENIFAFFSDEKNLELITPHFLNFHVQSKSTSEIVEGTHIHYKLKLHGLPMRWISEIRKWNPPNLFVDTQIKGPYQNWYHEHSFIKLKKGVLLIDRVYYKLPMGSLGQLVAGSWVDSDVEKIFAYRRKIIRQKFGSF